MQVLVFCCILLRWCWNMHPNFAVQVSFLFTDGWLHAEYLNHKVFPALQGYCKRLFFLSWVSLIPFWSINTSIIPPFWVKMSLSGMSFFSLILVLSGHIAAQPRFFLLGCQEVLMSSYCLCSSRLSICQSARSNRLLWII